MRTNIDYPFVCVHLRGEKQVYGFMLKDGVWSVTVRWMTSNDQNEGRNIQINHRQIEMIEHMELSEAPWNGEKNENDTRY